MKGVLTNALTVWTLLGLTYGCSTDRINQKQKEPAPPDIPEALEQTLPRTVIILGADIVEGRIQIRSGGSGTLKTNPTSNRSEIWTSHHIVANGITELRDLFIVGVTEKYGEPPKFLCAGVPSRGEIFLQRDLIKLVCDRNLLGKSQKTLAFAGYLPKNGFPPKTNVKPQSGDPVWIFGFGNSSGNRVAIAEGVLLETQGENSDQLFATAPITLGFSGGPAVDRHGHLLGIASGFRIATNQEQPRLREKIAVIRKIPETDVDF